MAEQELNSLDKAITSVANEVRQQLRNEHYDIEVTAPKGPDFMVFMRGAEGDVSEGRRTRERLDAILKDALKTHMSFDDLTAKITTVNKQDDLMFYVEIIFP